ncbi:MAG: glycine cleavage T C-terminal barrel domain-containing protein [Planctomycetota bacterium]
MISKHFESGCAVVDLTAQLALVRVTGADAFDYLQRTVSSDLRRLVPECGQRSTLLTPKGKMIAAFEVFRVSEADLVLTVERSAAAALAETIERFVILESVSIAAEEWSVLSLQGTTARQVAGALTTLAELPLAVAGSLTEGPFFVANDRCGRGGCDVWVRPDGLAETQQRVTDAGGVAVSVAALEEERIAAGVPRFGIDATVDNFPPESGWGDAVSYDKGCYTGQEVVARIRTYGHVNRQLCRLRFAAAPSAALSAALVGAEVRDGDGKVVGQVTSATAASELPAVALAYVRNRCADPGAKVHVEVAGGHLEATVAALPNAGADAAD